MRRASSKYSASAKHIDGAKHSDGSKHIMVIAGEVSGSLLGASLMKALRPYGDFHFSGVGGQAMIDEGLTPLMEIEKISSAGFIDVLLKAPLFLWRIWWLARQIKRQKPDLLVIIDSYDFTHRVARKVARHHKDIPIINYVPPKVWVWRAKRALKMKSYIARCFVILPFETKPLRQAGIETDYVGHPALERVASEKEGADFASQFPDQSLILLAPGSRKMEIKHLAPLFGEVARLIQKRNPDSVFLLPIAPSRRAFIAHYIKQWSVKVRLLEDEAEKRAAFRAADCALVASGTITLELALSNTPFICAYRMNRLEEFIFQFVLNLTFASPVNLILNREAFPEYLGKRAKAPALADAMMELMAKDKTKDLNELQARLKQAQMPSTIAAQKTLELL